MTRTNLNAPPDKLLRLPQVLELIPVSKSTLWSWVKQGKFPASVKIGDRTTCWREADVRAFIAEQG